MMTIHSSQSSNVSCGSVSHDHCIITCYAGPDTPLPAQVSAKKISESCITPVIHDYLSAGWDGVFADPASLILMADQGGRYIGVAASITKTHQTRLLGTPYYENLTAYFVMGMIDHAMQNTGLYRRLNTLRFMHMLSSETDLLFVRTQNHKVILGIENVLNDFAKDGKITRFTREYVAVEKGTYGCLLTAEAPDLTHPALPPEMRALDVHAGDVLLCIWRIKKTESPGGFIGCRS